MPRYRPTTPPQATLVYWAKPCTSGAAIVDGGCHPAPPALAFSWAMVAAAHPALVLLGGTNGVATGIARRAAAIESAQTVPLPIATSLTVYETPSTSPEIVVPAVDTGVAAPQVAPARS